MLKETVIQLPGRKIAAKIWNSEHGIPTLAIHGWLDNAASFDRLAPLLPNCHIVAIDLPGHGLSEHQPLGTNIHFIDFVATTIEIANHLKWDRFALLGHSFGGCIHSLVAGTIAERINWVCLIDGLGPITTPATLAPLQLRSFINELKLKPNKSPPSYAEKEEAILARLKVNTMHFDSAKILIDRALKQSNNGEWNWRTDPRLLMPSLLHLTEEQALAFLHEITAPVCLIRPEPGYPFPLEIMRNRIKALRHAQAYRIPGEHHVHLDNPESVGKCIQTFINNLEGAI